MIYVSSYELTVDKMCAKMIIDEMSANNDCICMLIMTVDEMSVDKMTVAVISVDEMPVGKMTFDIMFVDCKQEVC